jgi:tetratricopeptide (TPR) repeat protein
MRSNLTKGTMKKLCFIILCVSILTSPLAARRREPLANENKPGLYARSIEQVLRLKENEVDLATAVLIVSENWSGMVHGRRYLTELDNMALEVRERLRRKGLQADYRALPEINQYLFDELGFKSLAEASDPNSLFLHTVLDQKQGYCLSLSVLYLSLAERLGLPMYGVVVPGHFFVRYDDGTRQYNIETTSSGGTASDEQYIEKFNVPLNNRNGIYMKNLNKIQTLGCFFNNLGNSYDRIGDMDSALKAYQKAVEINPTLSESRVNVGNIYLKKGKVTEAVNEYLAALRINPKDATTHNNLGNAYTEQGQLINAVSEYQRSISLDPNFIDAYRGLAIAYSNQQRFTLAMTTLKRAIAIEPRDANCYYQMGEVYNQMGEHDQALSEYRKALQIEPNLVEAYYGLATCYNKMGLVDDEISAYQSVLALKPDMFAALVNLGNAYFEQDNYIQAIEQYKKAVVVQPGEAMLYYNLGAAYSNNKNYEQAITEYLKAIQIDPKIGDAHYGLAIGYYQLKKYESAWKHIRIAQDMGVEVRGDQLDAIKKHL